MIDRWAELAWTQLWQVTLTAAAIGLLVRLCARHRPRLAYLLWMLVVVKCVTPPIWSSPFGLYSQLQRTTPQSVENAAARPMARPILDDNGFFIVEETPVEATTPNSASRSAVAFTTHAASGPSLSSNVYVALIGLWICGMALIAWRISTKWKRFQRSLQTSAATADVERQVRTLADRLSMRRPPRTVWTKLPTVPAVFGFWRPTIVLPEFLLKPETDIDLEPILAHELVHLRRGDTLAGRLQLIVQTVWWFHPMIWWANAETRRERERSCDETVIAVMDYDPLKYAHSLVRIAELSEQFQDGRRSCPPTCIAAISSFRLLANRLEHITTQAQRFRRRMPFAQVAAAWGLAALLLPGAATIVWSDPLRSTAAIAPAPVSIMMSSLPSAAPNPPYRESVAQAPVLEGIQIDGRLDDWPLAMPRHAFTKILPDGAASWQGTDFATSPDLSCAFMVGYSRDEQLLYVAVVVRDDKLILGHTSDDDTDGMELYVDGLRSNRRDGRFYGENDRWFEGVNLQTLPVQQYCAIPGEGPVFGASKTTNPLLISGDLEQTKTKMAFTQAGDIITYEWAVQVFDHYPDRPTTLAPGKRIGFDVVVVDKDVPLPPSLRGEDEPAADRRSWIYWGPQWRGMKATNAGSLGEIVLGE